MLKIAICDDDVNFSGKFEDMLLSIKKQEHIDIEPEVYLDGKKLVEDICKKGKNMALPVGDVNFD